VANPTNAINTTQLPRAELDQDVLLELDTSILVVGESGTGKSNLTWDILNELNKNEISYRLFVIDPKKVELAELVDSPHTVAYSDTPSTIDAVIEKFYDAMMDTFERKMKPYGIRRVEISPDNPLGILLIDELLLCKQANKGIDTHLGEILSAGRAAGYIVIANSQLGQVDALSRLRDLFPQRVCMAVKSGDLTNAVLGPNAENRGARCTEITEKGVGYIFTDFTGGFQRFKLPFIADVRKVAMGGVYEEPKRQGPSILRGLGMRKAKGDSDVPKVNLNKKK
jgi:S-DNA-T family DNA segregation ATPase FtsK/SpoIIIE